jgi:two-component system response regulator AtoC
MVDWHDGQNKSDADRNEPQRSLEGAEWGRLEEIGDLHFHSSSFSSALDYYQRLLDLGNLRRIPLARCLEIHLKSVEAALNLGRLGLAESLLDQAMSLLEGSNLGADDKNLLLAPVLSRRASLLVHRGAYDKALEAAKMAFAILAVTDEHLEVANLQVTMGACHQRLGRFEKAEEFLTDALATFRRIGHDLGTAALYNNLALLHKNACRWSNALDLMEKAVSLATKHGATHLLSRLYLNQGIILTKINRLGEARTTLEKSLRLARSLGDRARQAKTCLALGKLEIQTRRLARAEELVLEGKMHAEQERFLREGIIADEYLGDILLARGQAEKALFNYRVGLEKVRALGKVNDLEGELLRRSAEAFRQLGRWDEAIESGKAGITVCEKCGETYEIGFCHLTLGRTFAAKKDWRRSDFHFRHAISLFRKQNLIRQWCQAILAYLEVRLETAGQAELLLLRRFLLTAQEEGASADSDRLLCQILEGLAEVQIRLGQYDDALLAVYELERNASGLEDLGLKRRVIQLRNQIEASLVGGLRDTENRLQAISGIGGLLRDPDRSIPRNLNSVLQAGMERVGARLGFIAMASDSNNGLDYRIAAREGLTDNLAEQLTRWFLQERSSGQNAGLCLFSRLDPEDSLLRDVPALENQANSCVFMPVALHGFQFGLLFLAKAGPPLPGEAFDRASLDFLVTYMGFLALFLFEKARSGTGSKVDRVSTPIEGISSFENIITQNEKMLDVLGLVQKVAPSNLTVLLNGETGTGKGLLAYAIHALSPRKDGKFLSINCAAIPETLLESELFGHVKGSFTGAHVDKRGLLEEAEGGTVFLDEIGKMPLSMQGKLLHFLDAKVVRPVGSTREKRVDVRILCASKANLQELAHRGLFLEDLYFRLLDFPLVVPPLRERRDDIPLLLQHFVERFSQELGTPPPACGSPFTDALIQHDWPGNIRELEKALKRAIVLAHGGDILRPEHLPAEIVSPGPLGDSSGKIPPLKQTLAAIECREIANTLKLTEGNKSQAARLLRISYPSLLKKIKLYGIQVD